MGIVILGVFGSGKKRKRLVPPPQSKQDQPGVLITNLFGLSADDVIVNDELPVEDDSEDDEDEDGDGEGEEE